MVDSSEVPASDRLEEFAELAIENFEREQASTALCSRVLALRVRHPTARERLAAIERAQSAAIERIDHATIRQPARSGATASRRMAKLVLALFHGIGVVGLFDPEAVDADFFEAAVHLVDRGLAED